MVGLSTERWFPILAGTFLLGALFEVLFLTTFAAALFTLLLVTSWWRWHALDSVMYSRKPFYRRAFPGESVALELEVENRIL